MKALRLFLLLGILGTFVFTSCNKDDQITDAPTLTDNELLTAIYDSEALIGNGKIKDGKYGVTIKVDELSEELRAQLKDKEEFQLTDDLAIDSETVKAIWGDQLKDTDLFGQGAKVKKSTVKVNKTYMSPTGEDLSAQVEANPELLNDRRVDIIEYWYLEWDCIGILFSDGSYIIVCDIYYEECTIIIF